MIHKKHSRKHNNDSNYNLKEPHLSNSKTIANNHYQRFAT